MGNKTSFRKGQAAHNKKWTDEKITASALQFQSRTEWSKGESGAYMAAKRAGRLDEFCSHMRSKSESLSAAQKRHSLKDCKADASLYQTKTKWQKAKGGYYRSAYEQGFLDECCDHMEEVRKPSGYWTLAKCMHSASDFSTVSDWVRGHQAAYKAAVKSGWLDRCCEHMVSGFGATDNNVVYLWLDAGTGLHKVGVTSNRIGEQRIAQCRRHNNMDPRIVFMLKVDDARAVEKQLLKLGTDPELDSSIDGYTEFRKLTNTELGQAVSIAYEAALSAA